MNRKMVFFVIVLAIASNSCLGQITPSANEERAIELARIEAFKKSLIGKSVTSFQLVDMNNNTWTQKKLKGKIVLMNFWFTSCDPCIHEMPLLNELIAANKMDSIVFLAPTFNSETQVKKFLTKYQFHYTIIASSSAFIDALKIENFPTHFVIDKKGIIRQVIVGYSDDIKEKLQQEIDKLNGNK